MQDQDIKCCKWGQLRTGIRVNTHIYEGLLDINFSLTIDVLVNCFDSVLCWMASSSWAGRPYTNLDITHSLHSIFLDLGQNLKLAGEFLGNQSTE